MYIIDMENLGRLEKEFCFDSGDFLNGGVLPYSVLKIFQDIAIAHAEALGVGFEAMVSKAMLWVTMRIKYQVLAQPKPMQKLKIVTYPSGKNMLEFDRDFLIFDQQNNLLIKGTSKWCLINKNTRRLAKMDAIDMVILPNNKPVFEEKFLKTDAFIPDVLADKSYQIEPNDIDNNGHTNNTIYAKLAQSLLCGDGKKIEFFQINFLKECLLGDRLDIYKKSLADGEYIVGKICEGPISFSAKAVFEE